MLFLGVLEVVFIKATTMQQYFLVQTDAQASTETSLVVAYSLLSTWINKNNIRYANIYRTTPQLDCTNYILSVLLSSSCKMSIDNFLCFEHCNHATTL